MSRDYRWTYLTLLFVCQHRLSEELPLKGLDEHQGKKLFIMSLCIHFSRYCNYLQVLGATDGCRVKVKVIVKGDKTC